MNLVLVGIFEDWLAGLLAAGLLVAGFVAVGFVAGLLVAGLLVAGSCTFRPYWVGFWQGGFTGFGRIF